MATVHASRLLLVLLATALAPSCGAELPGICGDGVVDLGEGCDDGNRAPGDGCSVGCTVEAGCGNLALDPGEGCDDGNRDRGDGCDPSCLFECGNGRLDPGEECDALQNPSDCDEVCHLRPAGSGSAGAPSEPTDPPGDDPPGDDPPGDDPPAEEPVDPGVGDIDAPPAGAVVTRAGELTPTSSVWRRPANADCTTFAEEDDFPYDTYRLTNGDATAWSLMIEVHGVASGGGTLEDPMVYLYPGAAIAAWDEGCAAGDDDGGEGVDPRVPSFTLEPGATALVVVTSFYRSPDHGYGTYTLLATGL